MMRALVFGGRGFLGSHVVRAFRADPRVGQVSVPTRTDCDLVGSDVTRIVDLLRAHRPDVVVNCTGRLDGTTEELTAANTLATAKIVDALEVWPARYVRIGSAGEYGPLPEGTPAHESAPAHPVSAYGATHLAATQLVALAVTAGRVDGVTLRVFNPLGPGVHPDTVVGRAVEAVRDAMRTGTDVTLGPLSAYRDFVDVRDVAAAVLAAAFARLDGPVINVGSGRATRVRDVVQLVVDAAGFGGWIRELPVANGRSAGVDWIQADIGHARRVLGWQPWTDLRETLESVWLHAITHPGMVTS